jgi:hypothetical protein
LKVESDDELPKKKTGKAQIVLASDSEDSEEEN